MKFCIECGQPMAHLAVADDRARWRCAACGYVHYENPKVLVACLACWQDKVLWMRRAQEPFRGGWTIPFGFMERGETLQQAAARELQEETLAVVAPESLDLYVVGTLQWMSEVHVVFRGQLTSPDFGVGPEAMEVALFAEHEVPWEQCAFPQAEAATREFYRELKSGRFGVHLGEYTPQANRLWRVARSGNAD